jgi:glyoxylate/hydroxypyruvate reductase A
VPLDGAEPGTVAVLVVTGRLDGDLPELPALRLIQSVWHGVDGLVGDPRLPDAPLARLVDPGVPAEMARYVARAILGHCQHEFEHAAAQAEAAWRPVDPLLPAEVTVGILGLGEVGRTIAGMARGLLHPVLGWRSRDEPVPGVEVHTGADGLAHVVSSSDVVVGALPSTSATRHLLGADLLASMPERATFVNVGRGDLVAERVLLDGLDAGRPSFAVLDVVDPEPLPEASPLWRHPRVRVTPHVSGVTRVATALPNLVANLHAVLDGAEPRWLVDRDVGY